MSNSENHILIDWGDGTICPRCKNESLIVEEIVIGRQWHFCNDKYCSWTEWNECTCGTKFLPKKENDKYCSTCKISRE